MAEFWEDTFKDKQTMWGFEPTLSALETAELFAVKGYKKILIPGIGYGRNARPFLAKGMNISGIEISETAIALAKKHFGESLKVYHGSVADMPFDNNLYDGIYCHALIHLLDQNERKKLITDCYHQLSENGTMVFTTISQKAQTYGQGTFIGKNRFRQFGGVNLFFYDEEDIQEEFGAYGLSEITEVNENYPFNVIHCKNNTTMDDMLLLK